MTWDPRARRAPQTIELECSRDPETGVAAASVTYTPWSTRERLAYEDGAKAATVEVTKPDGTVTQEPTMGRLRLYAMGLIVTDATGPLADLDWTDREAVSELAEEVYDEVVETALKVQPLPGQRVKKPADHKAAGDDDEDPSRTPSTPQA